MKKTEFQTNHKKKRKYYYLVIAFSLVTVLSFTLVSVLSINSSGDARGGSTVNSSEQFKFIMQNPIAYANILFTHLLEYLAINRATDYTSLLAYLSYGKDLMLPIGILIVAFVIDRNKYDIQTTNWQFKILNILIFGITICMVSTALYISFTPVGSQAILGCQYRYIIPMLFPLLASLGSAKIKCSVPDKYINLTFAIG